MMETMAAPIWPLEGAPKLILLFQGYLGPMLVKAQGKLKNKGLLESRHKAQSPHKHLIEVKWTFFSNGKIWLILQSQEVGEMRYNLEGQEISKEEEKGDGGNKGEIGILQCLSVRPMGIWPSTLICMPQHEIRIH